ncbi:hypothetical protein F2Q70_00013855 [Brassica cretica]|uniref:URB1 C-terminal domain-containing protein n=1 Tax=Brassica cretica TaxID=69181 RepID=A0A8S9M516_BRACR|nr:hypothetical protein F2Q70_00013855 [Brassica cretica]
MRYLFSSPTLFALGSFSPTKVPLLHNGVANSESGRLQEVDIQYLEEIFPYQTPEAPSIPSSSRLPPSGERVDAGMLERSPIRTLSEDRAHVSLRLGPLPPSVSPPSTRMTLRGTGKKKIAKTPAKKRKIRSPVQGISLNKRRVTKAQSSPKRKLILDSKAKGKGKASSQPAAALLAVAFVSMSSADLGMRKLAYDTIKMFLDVLENCTRNKQVKWIKLLLLCLKNGVEEPWQRIPTVSAVFAAEASLILLNSSHEHYVPIKKLLKSSPSLNLRGIPLFHEFLWSSAFNFKSQRLWELRLVCVGLKSDDDAKLYTRNSILEDMMSFFLNSSC